MRGITALSPSKIKFKRLYPIKGSWGTLASSTPKKLGNYDNAEGETVTKEKTEPMVAFSRPPPLPPVFGPLLLLSLLETWSSRDSNDD
ncbi:hypothetical protein D8674_011827 [Pyrus ussuriensis x Pyrus communis]|uniref:Uncharacterized protein n=1 Tax=Pyrus ussuriensis x Pyrus communis TaxID=2448454 RepID=A0A5N5FZT2_9ROSA|nr:hypothetical protein D8674_011827 [Pyrus ussuriensis x Pyrus communis]